MFKLKQSSYTVKEGNGHVLITVIRFEGDDESHELKWKTTDVSAIHDSDYVGGEHFVNMAKVSTAQHCNIYLARYKSSQY